MAPLPGARGGAEGNGELQGLRHERHGDVAPLQGVHGHRRGGGEEPAGHLRSAQSLGGCDSCGKNINKPVTGNGQFVPSYVSMVMTGGWFMFVLPTLDLIILKIIAIILWLLTSYFSGGIIIMAMAILWLSCG